MEIEICRKCEHNNCMMVRRNLKTKHPCFDVYPNGLKDMSDLDLERFAKNRRSWVVMRKDGNGFVAERRGERVEVDFERIIGCGCPEDHCMHACMRILFGALK